MNTIDLTPDLQVSFYYEPPEPPLGNYPGCKGYLDVEHVYFKGEIIDKVIDTIQGWNGVVNQVLKYIENSRSRNAL